LKAEFHADGQTDMTKLLVPFRNFPNEPKDASVRFVVTSSACNNSKTTGHIFVTFDMGEFVQKLKIFRPSKVWRRVVFAILRVSKEGTVYVFKC
jgi:hypothetical protein